MLAMKKYIMAFIVFLMVFMIAACGNKKDEPVELPDSTDQMFDDRKDGEVVYIFQMDGKIYMIEPRYEIDLNGRELEDGCFYRMRADITYLNGGVAGYVNYPDNIDVISIDKISAFDLDLPKVTEKRYGLGFIGDYADGDILLHEYSQKAVWKDGEWLWHYDKELKREDGSQVLYRDGVTEEQIEKGIEEGILSCAEYFVEPAISTD